jgi:hypothetical protein
VLNLTVEFTTSFRKFFSLGTVHKIILVVHNPIFINSLDASIPYLVDSLKWYIPCPKYALRVESIMEVFKPSFWLTVLAVFLLTSLMFWLSAKCSYRSVVRESHSYRTVIRCMYNVWCVMMGVSVARIPRTSGVRIVFCIFLCFSFVIT